MKIDHQYLKDLLIAFEDTYGPDTMLADLIKAGLDVNDSNMIFHMRLLYDNGLIVRVDGKSGFGHEMSRTLGEGVRYYWVDTPLRLTARGHDFIEALRQKEVWNTVKNNFNEASLSTLVEVAKQLAQGFAKQKVKQLTGFDPD
ncbi:DUF2513 domain-containing protein [Pantoea ananatis]|uniref:DUF2513 domain-containing protein n=1 Tax=Pantoea ananas TaxID=553 RepID=UPI003CF0A0D2